MERCAVVVAVEVLVFERELGEGVGAVDNDFNAAGAAIWQICLTGKIWPVRLAMWQMWITFVLAVMFSSRRLAK
jgi:hypothetical protein